MSAIEKLNRRLKKLDSLLAEREDIVRDIVNEITINEIKTKMYEAGYSLRIIDEVIIRDITIARKRIKYEIFNELLVGEGFDIAIGREEGIIPHDIFGNPVLVWQGKTIIGTPTTIFATHVKHPGVEATFIIRDTVEETQNEVQERYKSFIKNKIREIRNSS